MLLTASAYWVIFISLCYSRAFSSDICFVVASIDDGMQNALFGCFVVMVTERFACFCCHRIFLVCLFLAQTKPYAISALNGGISGLYVRVCHIISIFRIDYKAV